MKVFFEPRGLIRQRIWLKTAWCIFALRHKSNVVRYSWMLKSKSELKKKKQTKKPKSLLSQKTPKEKRKSILISTLCQIKAKILTFQKLFVGILLSLVDSIIAFQVGMSYRLCRVQKHRRREGRPGTHAPPNVNFGWPGHHFIPVYEPVEQLNYCRVLDFGNIRF